MAEGFRMSIEEYKSHPLVPMNAHLLQGPE